MRNWNDLSIFVNIYVLKILINEVLTFSEKLGPLPPTLRVFQKITKVKF